jgi:formate dehydrogenase major subunit
MTREDGEWKKVEWEEAYGTIADEMERIREEHGPDSVMWLGSAHHSNEEAYAFRKLASLWGTNNCDHQARICHSTTVAGLANTWGYGAMTNTINDYHNFDLNLIIGQNPAEAHPIAMQHILEGQKRGGKVICVDPRYTKTAAHADDYYRIRPGTDVALMMGLIGYLKQQGELNREFIESRVQGWADVEAELESYDLETVSELTWLSVEDIREIGDHMIEAKPDVQIEWAMGGTQHNNGTQNIRSYALAGLATGGIGRAGGGMQVMRGHANVQGATDLAVSSNILPGYYGVGSVGSWKYWGEVWDRSPFTSGDLSFQELYGRFDEMPKGKFQQLDSVDKHPTGGGAEGSDVNVSNRTMMLRKGLTVARWYEAALPKEDRLHDTPVWQPDGVKAAFYWGHSSNSITEMKKMKQAMENLDLLVVVDLFPSLASVLPEDQDNVLVLPAASQYEHHRTVTNSHRAVQWSEPVRPPSHETRPDLQIMQELAAELGMGEHFDWGSGPDVYNGQSSYEEAFKEVNLGVRPIGYQMSIERLKRQHEYDWAFSAEDTKCHQEGLPVTGEYWQLPWPTWGDGHPGTPILWRDDKDPRDGGQDFRTAWGTKAPTPEEWNGSGGSGGTGADGEAGDPGYPLSATYEQGGEDALSMIRSPYTPDWDSDYGGEIQGIPSYPGFTTALPDDLSNPTEPSLPFRYALDPTKSVYDTARELNKRPEYDFDLDLYEQYDYAQPDPPTGRGRARGVAWNFIDEVPVHREPIESPRQEFVEQWPANDQQVDFFRLNQDNAATQKSQMEKLANGEGQYDTIMTTGRQVEHQGGGSESRSNVFLADLQPHMYAEIHPEKADAMGIDGGDLVVVGTVDRGAVLVKARVTYRPQGEDEVFLPFHWGGIFQGKSLEEEYPEGMEPFAIGDSVNAITVRGYDVETQMQETKPSMVEVLPANRAALEKYNIEIDPDGYEFPQDRHDVGTQKDFDVRDYQSVQ